MPEPLLAAARQVRARARHVLAWQGRGLRHDLPSGLSVSIRSASDWAVYNEVFAEGEYDCAIRDVIETADADPYVVDLGANVGFFALRFADAWSRARRSAGFHVLAIEGAPRTFAELSHQLDQPLLDGRCTARHGLIGPRDGYGSISTSVLSGLNSMFTHQSLSRARVAFVDLERLVPPERPIDLLKCDIEGAEQAFLESYPALLRRVRRLVIELHHELCDAVRCRALLREAGLVHARELRAYPGCTVELYRRAASAGGARAEVKQKASA